MKVRVLMATLVITLLLGVQGFASPFPCDSACTDPCASCTVMKGDLFSGLKRLVSGVRMNNCDPCDSIVACNPCDMTECGPCDDVCGTKCPLGGRLRGLFASSNCSPCDQAECTPCGITDCDPCDPCGAGCGPKFKLRNLFSGLHLGGCSPCDACNTDCLPCDPCGDGSCGPCDPCGTGCGPRGHLLDLPRIKFGKLFSSCRLGGCDDGSCNPCDEVCKPCDSCF
ncbi:MAG: hypothetical protein LBI05_06050 [Planctomycetaceae bacterium]|jgi:hypothetical protein|nr:hypothetical protein [Planctomycetaceae bacterium]